MKYLLSAVVGLTLAFVFVVIGYNLALYQSEASTAFLSVTVAEPTAVPVLIEDVPMYLIDSEAEAFKKATK